MVRTQLNARVPGVPHTLSMRKWTKAVGEVVVCVHATHRNYYTVCYTIYFTTQHKLLHSGLLHYLLHQTEINRGHCEKRMWNNWDRSSIFLITVTMEVLRPTKIQEKGGNKGAMNSARDTWRTSKEVVILIGLLPSVSNARPLGQVSAALVNEGLLVHRHLYHILLSLVNTSLPLLQGSCLTIS